MLLDFLHLTTADPLHSAVEPATNAAGLSGPVDSVQGTRGAMSVNRPPY